jgi:hypothetical protein
MNERHPRINIYLCEFGCHTVTVDVAHGVTPFFIKCKAKPRPDRPIAAKHLGEDGECVGLAKSSMYPKGPKPPWIGEPTHEWYTPENMQRLTDEEADHVGRGGLLLRERTNAVPIYQGEER